jgi:hypothetical protein
MLNPRLAKEKTNDFPIPSVEPVIRAQDYGP